MTTTIVILDDEQDRLTAMTSVLSQRLPGFNLVTFKNASDIIDWLSGHLDEAAMISLDHDLFPLCDDDPDPGTGRDVADFLATQSPVCHVIIHTTNSLASPGMESVFTE